MTKGVGASEKAVQTKTGGAKGVDLDDVIRQMDTLAKTGNSSDAEWQMVKGKTSGILRTSTVEGENALKVQTRFAPLDTHPMADESRITDVVSKHIVGIIAPLVALAHNSRGVECKRA
ncbi:hypothetical protein Dimus_000979 [Dionaea muscipula]